MEDKTNARRIYSLVKQGGGIGGGMNGEAGEAMGDGSFAALMEEARKYIRMDYVWEEAPRRPDLIAAVIFAGSIHSRGYVICPGQQRRDL